MKDLPIKKTSFWNDRKELLIPYLNNFDKNRLTAFIQTQIIDDNSIKTPLDKEDYLTPAHYLNARIKLISGIIPDHLIADIFNIYFHSFTDISFTSIDLTNRSRFNLIMGVYDHPIKIVTERSIFNSTLYVLEICRAIAYTVMTSMDLNQIKSFIKQVHGENVTDNDFLPRQTSLNQHEKSNIQPEVLPVFTSLENNIWFKKALEKGKIKAATYVQLFSKFSEQINKAEKKEHFKIIQRFPLFLQNLELIGLLNSKHRTISAMVDQTIHASQGFLRSSMFHERKILEANEIHDFSNIAFVHPRLKNGLLDYAMVGEYVEQDTLKAECYLDISKSMDAQIKLHDGNNYGSKISALSFAKSVLFKFIEMNIMNSLILFNEEIHDTYRTPDEFIIMSLKARGKTDIDNVIRHQKLNSNSPSIIITDAQCLISQYSSTILIIGVPGSVFEFQREGNRFKKSEQVLIFNSAGELERWRDGMDKIPVI